MKEYNFSFIWKFQDVIDAFNDSMKIKKWKTKFMNLENWNGMVNVDQFAMQTMEIYRRGKREREREWAGDGKKNVKT